MPTALSKIALIPILGPRTRQQLDGTLAALKAARPQKVVGTAIKLRLDKRRRMLTMAPMHARREQERQAPADRLAPMEQTPVKCSCAAVYAVDEPQRLPATGYRRLGYSVTDPMEDAGQQESSP
jgi:hypothetical protein